MFTWGAQLSAPKMEPKMNITEKQANDKHKALMAAIDTAIRGGHKWMRLMAVHRALVNRAGRCGIAFISSAGVFAREYAPWN